ncbi:preprotein translocase subunit YajC [Pelagerythrobacter marensis]|uniref:Preprotein translocase subunit YajC n=1 Tax=Pelagerythrobacter marensis TaxID=543877 RepID=A0ABZ2D4S9_9SPHN
MKPSHFLSVCAWATLACAGPAAAQQTANEDARAERGERRASVDPYIEASQVLMAELSPGDDVVTYTQVAAGVDASLTGRNNGGSVSVRYERNIAYGDDMRDSDTVSGVARGYATVVPRTLTIEGGALAARTRVDGNGGATLNPLVGDDSESRIYSAYAGPNLHTRAGDVEVNANYRIGYTRVEAPDALVLEPGENPVDVFDESLAQSAGFHLGTKPGEPLPIGLGVGGGWVQEDVSNLDQRVRDRFVRGDVQVPVGRSLAVVGGVGYEDVEVSSRDAVRDADGNPVIGDDGRFVTDKSAPREIAYDVSGLIWDVGVMWRPSTRTALEAHVGRRYDSTTYYGTFAWAPNARSNVNVAVYDTVSGFGGLLNSALADLPTEFSAARNALSGDFTGCVGSDEGADCLAGVLGSVRSSVFRSRGIAASYGVRLGRIDTGVGAGYQRRKFIAAPGTVLESANGVVDEAYWVNYYLNARLGRNAGFGANAYASRIDSGFAADGEVLVLGASAAYRRSITDRLSARAAVAIDHLDSEATVEDYTSASALLGLRYDF